MFTSTHICSVTHNLCAWCYVYNNNDDDGDDYDYDGNDV